MCCLFLFHIDWTITATMVTENGCPKNLYRKKSFGAKIWMFNKQVNMMIIMNIEHRAQANTKKIFKCMIDITKMHNISKDNFGI